MKKSSLEPPVFHRSRAAFLPAHEKADQFNGPDRLCRMLGCRLLRLFGIRQPERQIHEQIRVRIDDAAGATVDDS